MMTPNIKLKSIQDWYQGFSIKNLLLPILGILVFLVIWNVGASRVHTSLGTFPGPVAVYEQFQNLIADHQRERQKEVAFYERQEKRNAKKLAKNPDAKIKVRPYTGKPTFLIKLEQASIPLLQALCLPV